MVIDTRGAEVIRDGQGYSTAFVRPTDIVTKRIPGGKGGTSVKRPKDVSSAFPSQGVDTSKGGTQVQQPTFTQQLTQQEQTQSGRFFPYGGGEVQPVMNGDTNYTTKQSVWNNPLWKREGAVAGKGGPVDTEVRQFVLTGGPTKYVLFKGGEKFIWGDTGRRWKREAEQERGSMVSKSISATEESFKTREPVLRASELKSEGIVGANYDGPIVSQSQYAKEFEKQYTKRSGGTFVGDLGRGRFNTGKFKEILSDPEVRAAGFGIGAAAFEQGAARGYARVKPKITTRVGRVSPEISVQDPIIITEGGFEKTFSTQAGSGEVYTQFKGPVGRVQQKVYSKFPKTPKYESTGFKYVGESTTASKPIKVGEKGITEFGAISESSAKIYPSEGKQIDTFGQSVQRGSAGREGSFQYGLQRTKAGKLETADIVFGSTKKTDIKLASGEAFELKSATFQLKGNKPTGSFGASEGLAFKPKPTTSDVSDFSIKGKPSGPKTKLDLFKSFGDAGISRSVEKGATQIKPTIKTYSPKQISPSSLSRSSDYLPPVPEYQKGIYDIQTSEMVRFPSTGNNIKQSFGTGKLLTDINIGKSKGTTRVTTPIIKQADLSKSLRKPASKEIYKSLPKEDYKTYQEGIGITKSGYTGFTPSPTGFPSGKLFGFPPIPFFPSGGLGSTPKTKQGKKQPKGYKPSLFAAFTGLKGKSTKGGIISGLGVRPLRDIIPKRRKK